MPFDYLKLSTTPFERFLQEQDKIDFRKFFGKMQSEARQKAKPERCFLCGKVTGKFCNSHFVPQFSLRSITDNGKLGYFNNLIQMPILNDEKGINEAGTFKIICRSCDGTVFQDYENPDNYENEPNEKMLAEIALKDYLKGISKRHIENEMFTLMGVSAQQQFGDDEFTSGIAKGMNKISDLQHEVKDLDLVEYQRGLDKAKKILGIGAERAEAEMTVPEDTVESEMGEGENTAPAYEVIYYRKLDYVAPIANQGIAVLVTDLDDNPVYNVYDKSSDLHPSDIHLCVLPIKKADEDNGSTVIIMFTDYNIPEYKGFIDQFHRLDEDDKLRLINYLVFLYFEDFFISPTLDKNIFDDPYLQRTFETTQEALGYSDRKLDETRIRDEVFKKTVRRFRLRRRAKVPNLLEQKYAVDYGDGKP